MIQKPVSHCFNYHGFVICPQMEQGANSHLMMRLFSKLSWFFSPVAFSRCTQDHMIRVLEKYLRDLHCFTFLNHDRQAGQAVNLSIQERYVCISLAFCALEKSRILHEASAHLLGRLLFLSLLWTDSLYLLFIAFSGWFQQPDRITEWLNSASLETDYSGWNPESSLTTLAS